MSGPGGVTVTPPLNESSVTKQINGTSCKEVDTSAHIFFMVFCSLVFVVGLFLNGFTLKVYFCRAQQQVSSSVTIYLKNLAAADFLISLCLPIRIINYASRSVPIHQVYCNFGASAFYLNMYASILFMGYIAANRYLKIVHPLGTHILQTARAAYIISTVTWCALLAMTTTYIVLSLVTQEKLEVFPNTLSCDVLHSKQLSLYYKLVHSCSAAIFLLVLLSLVFFYYSISRRLSLAQQRQPMSPSNKKLAKSRRNMLVLVSVFCVCFVPYHLVRLPYVFLKEQISCSQTFFFLKELSIMVSVLNVCLDPLIYFIFCKAFRAQLGLKGVFSTTEVATGQGAKTERRSSDGRVSSTRINRKLSLTTSTKQASVL
ncbi:P2Y purinoceptor 14-like [Dicentrarchus labrax]|uniref:G-protein coupled receptors family 1 profile domain-containing protein n=1 Tax=Dicentrarchus labrax TaxID=13489 RepID=A0A8P4KG52_DICLA|nr:P2Y purinoceptor 14-like [Dicentrarchus labrax]XP_051255647.1 P2Y purinoceptor 14-like [Dicentrarchus labrax]XP_051255648.1 P2Y purinoceptor 14-like [Dicentrarchus labrax]XP_051255649.1 P2Y purinoceptor 14-like [Dicentrarchus labrax]XP_051255650.1 P2Y purinoceptor 14-like [Dicentrarchus labrax]